MWSGAGFFHFASILPGTELQAIVDDAVSVVASDRCASFGPSFADKVQRTAIEKPEAWALRDNRVPAASRAGQAALVGRTLPARPRGYRWQPGRRDAIRIPHNATLADALCDARYQLKLPGDVQNNDTFKAALQAHNEGRPNKVAAKHIRAFTVAAPFHAFARVNRAGGALVPERGLRNESYFGAPVETFGDIKGFPYPLFDSMMAFNLDFLRKGLDTLARGLSCFCSAVLATAAPSDLAYEKSARDEIVEDAFELIKHIKHNWERRGAFLGYASVLCGSGAGQEAMRAHLDNVHAHRNEFSHGAHLEATALQKIRTVGQLVSLFASIAAILGAARGALPRLQSTKLAVDNIVEETWPRGTLDPFDQSDRVPTAVGQLELAVNSIEELRRTALQHNLVQHRQRQMANYMDEAEIRSAAISKAEALLDRLRCDGPEGADAARAFLGLFVSREASHCATLDNLGTHRGLAQRFKDDLCRGAGGIGSVKAAGVGGSDAASSGGGGGVSAAGAAAAAAAASASVSSTGPEDRSKGAFVLKAAAKEWCP